MVDKSTNSLLIKYHSINELREISAKILDFAKELRIWLFYGEMGIGKTTLIKEVCNSLGVRSTVTSPTFNLVNEYKTETGQKIFHFDFYRIEDETEALDIGYEEYFFSGNLCLVEWPENIPSLVPESYLEIKMKKESDTRTIHLIRNE